MHPGTIPLVLILGAMAVQVFAASRWGGRAGLIVFAGGFALCGLAWMCLVVTELVLSGGRSSDVVLRVSFVNVVVGSGLLWALFGSPALVLGLVIHMVGKVRGASWTQRRLKVDSATFD